MAELEPYRTTVRDEWIDYNGHLSEAYYVLVFGFATDATMDQLGMGADYRATALSSVFTVEVHVRYLDQVGPGSELTVRTTVIGGGGKRLRLWHELSSEGRLRATEEVMALHVDTSAGRSSVFPPDVEERILQHRTEPPKDAGRAIGW